MNTREAWLTELRAPRLSARHLWEGPLNMSPLELRVRQMSLLKITRYYFLSRVMSSKENWAFHPIKLLSNKFPWPPGKLHTSAVGGTPLNEQPSKWALPAFLARAAGFPVAPTPGPSRWFYCAASHLLQSRCNSLLFVDHKDSSFGSVYYFLSEINQKQTHCIIVSSLPTRVYCFLEFSGFKI